MLEDRDYMRQPEFRAPRVSMTLLILILNAIVFLVQLVVSNSPEGSRLENEYFALSLQGLENGRVWELLTFQFMHANWMHIIFNSLAIFFFGRTVETIIGARRFLTLYFCSGILGGVVQMLFTLLLPKFFEDVPVVGASAGAYGLVAAFAVFNWAERFTLFIYFIPIVMRGRTLLWLSIGIAVVGLLMHGSGIANAAHLGGILTGFFYVRLIIRGTWFQFPSRPIAPREFVATRAAKNSFWRGTANKPDEGLSPDEFLQKEVDPILDKISARGIQSLTARERQILETARAKMAKR